MAIVDKYKDQGQDRVNMINASAETHEPPTMDNITYSKAKRKAQSERTVTLGVRISPRENGEWRDYADMKGWKIADLVRTAVTDYIYNTKLTPAEDAALQAKKVARREQERVDEYREKLRNGDILSPMN